MLLMKTPDVQSPTAPENKLQNHHKSGGGFVNTAPDFTNDTALLGLLTRYISESRTDASPVDAIPMTPLSSADLNNLAADKDVVIRLGHSSIFMQVNGQKWLIDPVFSERASPFSFAGPKRFHQPPITLQSLPDIDGVLISHDHYDHLDKNSIKYLADKVTHFVVPLGVEQYLLDWKVAPEKVHSLDWWQSVNIDGLNLTATPAQHFSGRGLFDRDETLWVSYVIESTDSKLFFSGDSGYFEGFKAIGERFGPFDLTLIETGAYDRDWPTIHMTPEQSLQAHLDLKGKQMMPIHNGTFDLAFHSWYEPLQRISELAQQSQVALITPVMGQIITLDNIPATYSWWKNEQQLENDQQAVAAL